MRTTLDIDDSLLRQAKAFAASQQITLTRLIEESLSWRLRTAPSVQSNDQLPVLPVYPGRGGLQAGIVDALSQRALLDAADEADLTS